jgi:PII-like signaling protein
MTGAASLRGMWGFHGDHAPHGDKLLSIRRHVPVVTVAIDTPERMEALFGIVDELDQGARPGDERDGPANMALSARL